MAKSVTDIGRKLLTVEQWCIGWARISISDFLVDPASARFSWLEPSTSLEILADPFGLEENGKLLILAEQLKHGTSKGRLVLIDPHSIRLDTHRFCRAHFVYPTLFWLRMALNVMWCPSRLRVARSPFIGLQTMVSMKLR
jgi:hypothetical protein